MKKEMMVILTLLVFLSFFILVQSTQAEEASGAESGGDAALAQDLTNPLANLVTILWFLIFVLDNLLK